MGKTSIKEQAHELVDMLPDGATWEDLIREVYVREAIERGLEDSKAGRVRGVKEVREQYGLGE
jgi:predicted transcriptional regulator